MLSLDTPGCARTREFQTLRPGVSLSSWSRPWIFLGGFHTRVRDSFSPETAFGLQYRRRGSWSSGMERVTARCHLRSVFLSPHSGDSLGRGKIDFGSQYGEIWCILDGIFYSSANCFIRKTGVIRCPSPYVGNSLRQHFRPTLFLSSSGALAHRNIHLGHFRAHEMIRVRRFSVVQFYLLAVC